MAVKVSRPGGRFTRISPAPSYSTVISRYSNQIQQALADEETAEVEGKILAYKNGNISWDDMKRFMEQKVVSATPGTLKQTKYQQTLVDLGTFENERQKQSQRASLEAKKADQGITPKERLDIEKKLLDFETPGTKEYTQQQSRVIDAYEGSETQKIMQRREELLKKYEKGGITLEEQFAINQELKGMANPDSQIWNQLITQEQQLREQISTQNKGAGQTALTNTSRDQLAAITAAERQSDINYQNGIVSGNERDIARLQNAKEAVAVLNKMAQAGISIPIELLTSAQNNLNDATALVQARQNGALMDIVDNSGVIRPVTNDGRDPFTGKAIDYQNYPVQLNPQTGLWEVYDPATGQVINRALGSKKAAEQFAENEGLVTFDAIFTDRDGKASKKTLSKDKETGLFYDPKNPKEVFLTIPQTAQDYGKTVISASDNWRTDPGAREALKKQVEIFRSTGVNLPADAVSMDQGQAGTQQQPQQKGFLESVGDFFGNLNDPERQAQANARGEKLVSDVGKGISEFGGNVVKTLTSPETSPLAFAKDIGQKAGQVFSGLTQSTGKPAVQGPGLVQQIGSSPIVQNALSSLQAGIGPVAQNVGQQIGQTFGQTVKSVQQAPSAISSGLSSLGANLSGIGSSIGSAISNFKLPPLPSLPEFKLPPLPNFNFSLPSFGGGSSKSSSSPANIDFLGGIKQLGSNIGSAVSSGLSSLGSAASGLFNKAKGFLGF